MNTRLFTSYTTVIIALFVGLLVPSQSRAQTAAPPSLPQTPDGRPDLQGIWDFRTITPLERPDELEGRQFLTDEEAAAFEAETLAERDKDLRASDGLSVQQDVSNAYNQFWWDYGTELTDDRRTSLIVDPPDGRIPPLKLAGRQRVAGRDAARGRPAHGPEDRSVGERCMLGFNSGPPMEPRAYNNNMQLFQIPGYVVILNEMAHNARIIPLDERPRVDIPQWVGNSRGRWDGDTLVVETRGFYQKTAFSERYGASTDLRLLERFTRRDADTLLYEFTVEDPSAWTEPWTAQIPMKKSDAPLYEYACHEGNYGMTNLLLGARVEDKAAAEAAAGSKESKQ